ncbi:hypothetical protein HRbin17_00781 [bacterium HR17]|jgi:uncharacterized membrane protein YozB (DUF420 family)|uniref:DUF420 domain-containing protein n=1 Tax=Candidatus Fervidibacter japonicus TaxID=2035412 RepID=A0A2H5XAR5_9BACT|nr:hypothetical protein HRbin17_00781 [bacterium HR17]
MLDIRDLPTVNAVLNATSAALLAVGYAFIRKGNIAAHRACMLGAVVASALFFASYTVYHAHAGTTKFAGTGWVRLVYFTVLISHTVLAAVIVPMVLVTLLRALRSDFQRHRALARWTLPLWLYVSVTGVLIYLMLYHWYPSR